MEKFKVLRYEDYWQVREFNPDEDEYETVFQGTLPECEAWISLHDKGYL